MELKDKFESKGMGVLEVILKKMVLQYDSQFFLYKGKKFTDNY